jgi:P-type E1-E2 ATPase
MRHRDGGLEEVPLDLIAPGDRLLIRQGDVLPVDGTVVSGVAVLDQSALTGEAMPVQLKIGQQALSGSTNVGEAFSLLATIWPLKAPMPVSSAGWRRPSAREYPHPDA